MKPSTKAEKDKTVDFNMIVVETMSEMVGDALEKQPPWKKGDLDFCYNLLDDYGVDRGVIDRAAPHLMAHAILEKAAEKLRTARLEIMKEEGLSLTPEAYKKRWEI